VEVGHGAAALDRLYTALGTRIHGRGEEVGRPLLEGALADAGLPGDLADAGWSTAWDERVRASHHDAMARVGPEVGTPVLGVGDVAFFGPVVSPPPAGEAAGRLWDGLVLVMTTPGFYELKRARTQGPRST
jgi:hypothetical protein